MNHAPSLRPHHIQPNKRQPNKRQLAVIAVAIVALVTSCGSDASDDAPATTHDGQTLISVPSDPGGAGVPLEPGSNLPPSGSETTPSGTTVGSELLAPTDSLVGSSGD